MLWYYFVSQGLLGRKVLKVLNNSSIQYYKSARMSTFDYRDMRIKYKEVTEAFTEDQLVSDDPIEQFTNWFEQVKKCPDIMEPNAMCLATSTSNGLPSARMVLLKSYGPNGFTFFTNYESRKGCELEENPSAALLFYWPQFYRQVRIEGKVSKISEDESTEYFNKRPFDSRISAAISPQSKLIPNRDYLVNASNELKASGTVSRPLFWGGFTVFHENIEFWQGQSDRLHDRIVYSRENDKWIIKRLAP